MLKRLLPRTILLTGGAGYIGSHVALALLDAGYAVVVLDDLSTGSRDAVPDGCDLVVGGVADEPLVSETIGRHRISAVIHMAGSLVVPESLVDPLKYYLNNVAASVRLFAVAAEHGVRHVVFSSTAAVYGNPSLPQVSEATPTAPIHPYGRSKLAVEWMLRDLSHAAPIDHAVLRYFNVVGADPAGRAGPSDPNATHLMKIACQAASGARTHVDVYGTDYPTADGTCVRDFIHVHDLASAHVSALARLEARSGHSMTLNCGYGRGYSVLELIDAVEAVSGRKIARRPSPRRAGDPAAMIADATRIKSELDWRPRYDDLTAMARSAWEWECTLGSREDAVQGA